MDDHRSADCAKAVHELYLFLDGELTAEKRARIQGHLEGCLPCYEAFDFEAELRQLVAMRCRDRVPEGLRERILRAIQQTPPPEHL